MGRIEAGNYPRLVLAGTGSGCGKTTVMCALLGALKRRGIPLRSFKCGPDYIDPMFHREALGVPCRNLDSFLCGEAAVEALLGRNGVASGGINLIEGVMGLYDGLGGVTPQASTSHIAQILRSPVVLVCSPRGKSLSLAAELRGYREFGDNHIAGVILNGIKPHSYPMYREIAETHAGLEVLGYLPPLPQAELKSRHLGLITAGEVKDLQQRLDVLAEQGEATLRLDRLLELAGQAPALSPPQVAIGPAGEQVTVAVARDKAFCFYYQDNLDLLEEMGVKLVAFSPLEDTCIPPCHGLLLGGGYPELYGERLAQNKSMGNSLRDAVSSGMPTIAECGGFMLLATSLTAPDGVSHPMAGALEARIAFTNRLQRFGYLTLTANRDNLLCGKGERIRAHSFHYSRADREGDGFVAEKSGGARWETGFASHSLYGGYPHLHFWQDLSFGMARRFVDRCGAYKRKGEA